MTFFENNRVNFTPKNFKKNETIINYQQVCSEIFFIESGLLKLSSYKNDNELILNFFKENSFCTAIDSLLTKKRTDCELVAVENSHVLSITLGKLEQLCKSNPEAEKFLRLLITNSSIALMERVKELLLESPETRYESFLRKQSDLVQRLFLGDIAKYVGISQVSLSRIRSR